MLATGNPGQNKKKEVALPRAGAQTIDVNELVKVLASLISSASHGVVSENEVATDSKGPDQPGDNTSKHKEEPK
jgi:hypothetical protein